MDVNDEFSCDAALRELGVLKRVHALMDAASEEMLHPDLTLVDVPDIADATAEVAVCIEAREEALTRYREGEVGEARHRRGLAARG